MLYVVWRVQPLRFQREMEQPRPPGCRTAAGKFWSKRAEGIRESSKTGLFSDPHVVSEFAYTHMQLDC